MPDEVRDKIKMLNKLIPKVEWSGIILYTTEGSITKPESFKINLKDIIPMHKGDSSYTTFQLNKGDGNDPHIDYCIEHEEAFEWRVGLIHSHNIMRVFFSGTDLSELYDNSDSHDFYFSIVVNSYMDMVASIAIAAHVNQTIECQYIAPDGEGGTFVMQDVNFKIEKKKLFVYDCDIQVNQEQFNINDELFNKNLNDIIKEAEITEKSKVKYPVTKTSNYSYPPKKVIPINNSVKNNKQDIIDEIFDFFIISIILMGNQSEDAEYDIISAIKTADAMISKPKDFIEWLSINYASSFALYYGSSSDPETFVEVTEEIIDTFSQYQLYPFIIEGGKFLENIITKFKNECLNQTIHPNKINRSKNKQNEHRSVK